MEGDAVGLSSQPKRTAATRRLHTHVFEAAAREGSWSRRGVVGFPGTTAYSGPHQRTGDRARPLYFLRTCGSGGRPFVGATFSKQAVESIRPKGKHLR